MLCLRCSRRLVTSKSFTRGLFTTQYLAKPTDPPAATSTSAAQPFSTPLTPSPSQTIGTPKGSSSSKDTPAPKSSLAAGTALRGLDYIKGADPPLAREDSAYPPWLWTILEPKSSADAASAAGDGEQVGDAFAKSKKQRRLAAKAARARTQNPHNTVHTVKVPLHEQSVDLPGSGTEARVARDELGASMRDARRKKIKEQNFLKGMR